jgi:GNAT superfamily N-acetyltransferase
VLAGFEVRSFDRDQDTDELVTMWRASFEWGVGVTDPYPVEEQTAYLLGHVVPSHRVVVAHDDSGIVGFLASTDDSVGQLYVRVDRIGRGIGSRLLQLAKQQSSGHLWLYTFARNHRALAFYSRHGFAEVARGVEPTWQLEDVRMEWTRPGAPAGPAPPSRLRPTSSPAADAVAPEVESPASTPSPTSVATSSNGP